MASNQSLTMSTLNSVSEIFHQLLQSNNADLIENSAQIDLAYSLFSDEQSKYNFKQELGFLITKKLSPIFAELLSPMSPSQWQQHLQQGQSLIAQQKIPLLKVHDKSEEQSRNAILVETFVVQGYRYQDLVKVEPGEVFIDCGAYLGDTAIWAYQNQAAKVYSLEPCPMIWQTLQTNLADNNLPKDFYPLAVGSENAKLHFVFCDQNIAGARLIKESELAEWQQEIKQYKANTFQDITVDCVKLDDWFAQQQITPTYIKMDIEGGELDALIGCSETIKKLKPKLAICLYHKREDMWKIPLFIHSLVPEYKFYCRKNLINSDFVMFATL